MRHEHLYMTSDLRLAAYLLLEGFELLGAVDNGGPRKEFALTHTDTEILQNMESIIAVLADEFENFHFTMPSFPERHVNFRMYATMQNQLHRALDEARRAP